MDTANTLRVDTSITHELMEDPVVAADNSDRYKGDYEDGKPNGKNGIFNGKGAKNQLDTAFIEDLKKIKNYDYPRIATLIDQYAEKASDEQLTYFCDTKESLNSNIISSHGLKFIHFLWQAADSGKVPFNEAIIKNIIDDGDFGANQSVITLLAHVFTVASQLKNYHALNEHNISSKIISLNNIELAELFFLLLKDFVALESHIKLSLGNIKANVIQTINQQYKLRILTIKAGIGSVETITNISDGKDLHVNQNRDPKIQRVEMSNNEVYEGELVNNQPHGQGTYLFVNGNRYIGTFKDGKRHGVGTFMWSNGDVYKGEYQNDKRKGQGIFQWAIGDIYEGEHNDLPNGFGRLTWKNGNHYEGEFINGHPSDGTYYFADGTARKLKRTDLSKDKTCRNSSY